MVAERRRHLRHKVHSPAYASIGAGVGGVVLDANERGAAIESVAHLTPQSYVDLRLDLLDTRGTAVTPARVAWRDEAGRVGVEFLNLTGESRRQLQQWLLLNALLAAENAGKLSQTVAAASGNAAPSKHITQAKAAGDLPFGEVAERALACTEAHGAAIALADDEAIVCRATAGDIAPPPGTKLDTRSGISGACVRSGRWLRCDDPRLDPHVDRDSCHALGINSVLAVPLLERGQILGLIEVFSRSTYAFSEEHCSALQELAKAVALSLRPEAPETEAAPAAEPQVVAEQTAEATPTAAPSASAAPIADTQAAAAPDAALAKPSSSVPSSSVPVPPTPADAPGPAPMSSSEPRVRTSLSGGGGRVVLFGLLAMLVIVSLWFLLGRGGGGTRNVDAAEAPPGETQDLPPPTSDRGSADVPAASAAPELSDSVRALRQEAAAGGAEAAFELGARYASGEDVVQDYGEAVKWFTLAADHGQVLAAATLGAYYWAGRGVPQDDVSAYMWSAIAKEGGDEASKYRLAILRARMTAAQVSEAEQRASSWRHTHARSPLAGQSTAQP